MEVILNLDKSSQSYEDKLSWSRLKRTGGEKGEEANVAISMEMFYYGAVQRGSHGVKE